MGLAFRRILLKLSGEALMGKKEFGIDNQMILHYAEEIKSIQRLGVEVAVVIGGGNIYRGVNNEENVIERVQGDYMGMLATVINGMALQSTLESIGVYTRLISAIEMKEVAEPYIRRRAVRHLEKGRVVIFSGGTGNPYFTTDSAAALRAIEVSADVILKGTKVSGVFTEDPEKNPNAEMYDHLTFDEAIDKSLRIMDKTAFTLCQENNLPIIVFNIYKKGNLQSLIQGGSLGSVVSD